MKEATKDHFAKDIPVTKGTTIRKNYEVGNFRPNIFPKNDELNEKIMDGTMGKSILKPQKFYVIILIIDFESTENLFSE